MALIKIGTTDDFTVGLREPEKINKKIFWTEMNRIADVREVTRSVDPTTFEFKQSKEERGLGIKRIELQKGFEGILGNMFNEANEIYFVAWTWDLSGAAVQRYPGEDFSENDVIIKIESGTLREFIGSGINLFNKRKVTGGMGVRIQLWESDEGTRKFGEVLSQVTDSIQKSELNNLLTAISLTGAPVATVTTVVKASLELAKIIGSILKANSNDYVDYFEGYYSADSEWSNTVQSYQGFASKIDLQLF